MNSCKRFDETSLPFYSKLNEKGISNIGHAHSQNVWEVFEIKNLGEYHDLYAQSDTLLLADVFENFRNKCIEIYEFDPAHFLSAPGLAWLACLKRTAIELELLTDYNMFLMVEKGIKGGKCDIIHRYAKASNKYMKNYVKSIISSYLTCLDANNLYEWGMYQKLPANGFKWVKDLSHCNEDFIKNYDQNSDKGYIFK